MQRYKRYLFEKYGSIILMRGERAMPSPCQLPIEATGEGKYRVNYRQDYHPRSLYTQCLNNAAGCRDARAFGGSYFEVLDHHDEMEACYWYRHRDTWPKLPG